MNGSSTNHPQGAFSLSAAEANFLDTNGFLPLGQLLSPEQVEAIRRHVQDLVDQEGEDGGSDKAPF